MTEPTRATWRKSSRSGEGNCVEVASTAWRKSSRSNEGNCVEVASTAWRKSSRSNEGNCVEVAGDLLGVVGVRDSKDSAGPVLTFTPPAWRAFLTELPTQHGQPGTAVIT
jgi:uncharacterized low-complexity protein